MAQSIWSLPDRYPWLSLAIAIVAVELVGSSGAIFTSMGLESWYPALTRPSVAPPNWLFGPVWGALFALLGVAVWRIWRRANSEQARAARIALGIFAIHFAVNVAWSGVFFGLQSLLGGLIVIGVLWVLIVGTMWAFARVDRTAALLFVPYLAWVTFAAYLNYAFYMLN